MIPPNFTRGLHLSSQKLLIHSTINKCRSISSLVFVIGKFFPHYLCHSAYWVIKPIEALKELWFLFLRLGVEQILHINTLGMQYS